MVFRKSQQFELGKEGHGYDNSGLETDGSDAVVVYYSYPDSKQDGTAVKTPFEFQKPHSEEDETEMGGSRDTWSGNAEFVLAAVGNAVGLGNLWRFPYLCYDSGGGAFLIPYFIMLVVCGIPLLYMELAAGQWTRMGPIGAMGKLSPIFMGAGMATVVLSFLFVTYYNVIVAWALFYMGASCQEVLPWGNCNNSWNSPLCWDDYSPNATALRPNNSRSPSEEFYENQVLKISSGIEEQGVIQWQLALLLLLAWTLVFFCVWKGVRWTGKVVYVTATFPYVIILILMVRGLTLPGASTGVDFFIRPDWELLKSPTVWVNAAAQNFNSIGIAFGSMITYGSYNKKETKIFRNVLVICLLNSFTSILAGFTVFSILGNIALNQGKEVTDIVTGGPGLVFIVYPEAFTTMPYGVAQFLAFIFFMMLVMLAIDSQFASVEVVIATLEEHFGKTLLKYLRRREVLVFAVCVVCYFLGFPNITNGGIYFFQIIDKYSSGISLMLIALFECIGITWVYGARRLASDIRYMTGSGPNIYFLICWYALSPLLIAGIMIFNWIEYSPVTYGDYVYPAWADGLGWFLAGLSLVCLPIGAIRSITKSPGSTFLEKFKNAFKSNGVIDTRKEAYESKDEMMTSTTDMGKESENKF